MLEKQRIYWPGWETVRLIGRGSFGEVYEIQRKVFDDTEKAALKVISIPQNSIDIEEMYSDGYDDESITSTFQSHLKSIVAEYSLMKKMNDCVNIVHCDDVRYVQHDDGIGWDIFIKMELLTPLTKALPSDISEETVIKLGMDICRALMACSKYGIIHRDIKPQNIFISSNGDYKLGDFGIAKTVEKTMGGTKIGTYKYMAPEVYNNQPYGQGADIYSLGLVLYSLLNERRMPFMPLPPVKLQAGMDEEARTRRFSGEQIPAPAHGSEKMKQIIMKACAFDPKARYQNAGEMLNDLNELCGISKQIVYDDKVVDNSEERHHCCDERSNDNRLEDSFEDIDNDINDDFSETINDGSNEITNSKSKKGKKIILAIGLGIVLFLLLRYCVHIHNWSIATCTMPKVCECGETEGNPLGHQWLNATCTQPQTCTRCGVVEGNSLGHLWQNATCTQPQTCSRCGVTGGGSLGHQWKNATCTEPQTCIRCGIIEGSAMGHQWVEATYETPKTCSVCALTEGTAKVKFVSFATDVHTLMGLKEDGTVIVSLSGELEQSISAWEQIVSVSGDGGHYVGLKSDGTVIAVGYNGWGQCNVSEWYDIVAISTGANHTVGLKSDGTVVATGTDTNNPCDVSGWRDIIAISAGQTFTMGLKSDGTVVTTRGDIALWDNIIKISAGDGHLVGLKSDGTVVAMSTTSSDNGQCDVDDWNNIVDIYAGYDKTVGLKSDGTVVVTGERDKNKTYDLSDWNNIMAIAAGDDYIVGLKSDGTVVFEGEFMYKYLFE